MTDTPPEEEAPAPEVIDDPGPYADLSGHDPAAEAEARGEESGADAGEAVIPGPDEEPAPVAEEPAPAEEEQPARARGAKKAAAADEAAE